MLNKSVLVLNRLWQAVNICSARRAFCLIYQGHANVVLAENGTFRTFTFDDWREFSQYAEDNECVHTVSYKLKVPSIILLLFYDKLPAKEVKFTRYNVYKRDKNTCQYCGRHFDTKDLTIDHVVPLSRGGRTTWTNVVCACVECNRRKGNKTLEEAGMRLIRPPRKPRWHPFANFTALKIEDESWNHFLDLAYWHVELGDEE